MDFQERIQNSIAPINSTLRWLVVDENVVEVLPYKTSPLRPKIRAILSRRIGLLARDVNTAYYMYAAERNHNHRRRYDASAIQSLDTK